MAALRARRPAGESFPRRERLRRRNDFLRCYREGRRRHGELVVLHALANGTDAPRLGLTVGRKVGGAVVRNRVKRRVREIYRRWSERSRLPGLDLVVHAKPPAGSASFAELEKELERLLSSLLLQPTPQA
jgi:ribonuclease P protein component